MNEQAMPEGIRKELITEYYKLNDIVSDFDKHLLTVKGWSVTLSLAALAWGIKDTHYGLFLVAAMSGLAFWIVEGLVKRIQMRFNVRIREIEVICFDLSNFELPDGSSVSTPQIDWSWVRAPGYFNRRTKGPLSRPERRGASRWYTRAWLLPHVALPHVVSVAVGGVLFLMGALGVLGGMPL
jgi:hypothetical protein